LINVKNHSHKQRPNGKDNKDDKSGTTEQYPKRNKGWCVGARKGYGKSKKNPSCNIIDSSSRHCNATNVSGEEFKLRQVHRKDREGGDGESNTRELQLPAAPPPAKKLKTSKCCLTGEQGRPAVHLHLQTHSSFRQPPAPATSNGSSTSTCTKRNAWKKNTWHRCRNRCRPFSQQGTGYVTGAITLSINTPAPVPSNPHTMTTPHHHCHHCNRPCRSPPSPVPSTHHPNSCRPSTTLTTPVPLPKTKCISNEKRGQIR